MAFQKSADPKTALIKFRVTPTEKAAIEADAAARHLTVSEFAMRRMLGMQAPAHFGSDAFDPLIKLILELKIACRDGAAGPKGKAEIALWRDLAVEALDALQRK